MRGFHRRELRAHHPSRGNGGHRARVSLAPARDRGDWYACPRVAACAKKSQLIGRNRQLRGFPRRAVLDALVAAALAALPGLLAFLIWRSLLASAFVYASLYVFIGFLPLAVVRQRELFRRALEAVSVVPAQLSPRGHRRERPAPGASYVRSSPSGISAGSWLRVFLVGVQAVNQNAARRGRSARPPPNRTARDRDEHPAACYGVGDARSADTRDQRGQGQACGHGRPAALVEKLGDSGGSHAPEQRQHRVGRGARIDERGCRPYRAGDGGEAQRVGSDHGAHRRRVQDRGGREPRGRGGGQSLAAARRLSQRSEGPGAAPAAPAPGLEARGARRRQPSGLCLVPGRDARQPAGRGGGARARRRQHHAELGDRDQDPGASLSRKRCRGATLLARAPPSPRSKWPWAAKQDRLASGGFTRVASEGRPPTAARRRRGRGRTRHA